MKLELLIDIIGWIGGIEVTIGYVLISLKKIKAENFFYQFVNLTGAFLLIINTWYHKAYPSAVVNIIWVTIAVYSFIKYRSENGERKFP